MGTPTRAEQLLSIPEVARRLGISRTSVYDLVKTQRLPVHNVGTGAGTRMRVKESELDRYIDSTEIAPLRSHRSAA